MSGTVPVHLCTETLNVHPSRRIVLALAGIVLPHKAAAQTVIPGARVRVVDVQSRTALLTGEFVRMTGDTITIVSAAPAIVYAARIEATAGLLLGEVVRIDSAPFETFAGAEAFAQQTVEANFQAGRGVPTFRVREVATSPREGIRQSTTVLVVRPQHRLEVSAGRHRRTGTGIALGFVAGAVTGAVLGSITYKPGGFYVTSQGGSAAFGGILLAVPGMVIGGIIGYCIRSDDWRRVDHPPVRLGVAPGSRGVLLTASLAF